jgi:hypothetical protein
MHDGYKWRCRTVEIMIGGLSIEFGKFDQEKEASSDYQAKQPTADELYETAVIAQDMLEIAERRYGEDSMPLTEAQVEKLFKEVEALRRSEMGKVAVSHAEVE